MRNRNKNKIISMLLCTIMVFSLFTMNVFAEVTTYDISENQDGSVIATFDTVTGTLTISGNGATMDYDVLRGASGNTVSPLPIKNIVNLVVEEGVTYLGNYLFYNYNSQGTQVYKLINIKSLSLPNSLTGIGEWTFAYMNDGSTFDEIVSTVVIPENVTSIGDRAFQEAEVSEYFLLSKSSQTIGDGAFRGAANGTMYLYRANTGASTAAGKSSNNIKTKVYLDDMTTSGTTDNGIVWTYDEDKNTLTFEGDGEIPTYDPESSAPWYGANIIYGSSSYVFGSGITGIGSAFAGMGGSRIDYGYGGSLGSGVSVYAPSGLSSSISSAVPGATVSDVSDYNPDNNQSSSSDNTFDETAIIVDAEASLFKVTVPIRIDVSMDKDGVITTGTDYKVENECPMGPIIISEINVVSRSEWEITDFNADYKNMRASSNKIGMTINEAEVETDGTVALNDSLSSVIKNKESKDLSFEVKMPAQKTALVENVLAVVFTLDFDKV